MTKGKQSNDPFDGMSSASSQIFRDNGGGKDGEMYRQFDGESDKPLNFPDSRTDSLADQDHMMRMGSIHAND